MKGIPSSLVVLVKKFRRKLLYTPRYIPQEMRKDLNNTANNNYSSPTRYYLQAKQYIIRLGSHSRIELTTNIC